MNFRNERKYRTHTRRQGTKVIATSLFSKEAGLFEQRSLIGHSLVRQSLDVTQENLAARYGFKVAASILGSRSPVVIPIQPQVGRGWECSR